MQQDTSQFKRPGTCEVQVESCLLLHNKRSHIPSCDDDIGPHGGNRELALATELATNRKIKQNNPPHNSFYSPSEVVRLDQPGIVVSVV